MLATLVLVLLVGAYVAWRHVDGAAKLRPLDPLPARGNYVIELEFAPERFHLTRLQDAGRVIEVRGRDVYMMDVAARDVAGIAREYWVERIERWPGR
jgi:hypothetical protein